MPKKTYTLNGFSGGMNQRDDYSDLKQGNNQEHECVFSRGLMLDSGRISAEIPTCEKSVDTTCDTGDNYANKIVATVANDGTISIEAETGIYTHGEHINWSNNSDYRVFPPSVGKVNDNSIQSGHGHSGIDVTLRPTRPKDTLVWIGENAEQYPQVRWATSVDRPGLICNTDTLGDGTTSGARAPDDFVRVITGGAITDGQAGVSLDRWDDTSHSGSDWAYEVNHIISSGVPNDWRAESADSSSYTITFTDGTNSLDINSFDGGNFNGFSCGRNSADWSSFSYGNTMGLVLRAGRVDSETNGFKDNGLYGASAPYIGEAYIYLEYRLTDVDELTGIFICADSHEDDMQQHFNASDTRSKIWFINKGALQDGMVPGSDYGTVCIPYSESISTGASYNASSVRMFWVFPWWSGGSSVSESFMIRELSFISKPSASNLWGYNKYAIYQTVVKNGIESLPTLMEVYDEGNTARYWYQTVHNKLKVGFTCPASNTGQKGKIYYRTCNDQGEPYGEMYLLTEYEAPDGGKFRMRISGQDDWKEVEAGTIHVDMTVNTPPIETTFELETGYPDETEHINAKWIASAVIGSQVYIGNVEQPAGDGYVGSKILKTTNGRHAGFSDLDYIDLDLQGDEITVMESSGDRLFVFGHKDLYVINVAQDIEYLEATLPSYGIDRYAQVCKVGEGIAFINSTGVYLFDGKGFTDIYSDKIFREFWKFAPENDESTFEDGTASQNWHKTTFQLDADTCGIMFEPVRNNLICTINEFSGNSINLSYNLDRKIWTSYTSKYWGIPPEGGQDYAIRQRLSNAVSVRSKTGTNDPDFATFFIPSHSSGTDVYYLEYNSNNIGYNEVKKPCNTSLLSGVITCGDINRRKKFYKVYINCDDMSDPSTQDSYLYYSVDKGQNWYLATKKSGNNYLETGENEYVVNKAGKSIIMCLTAYNAGSSTNTGAENNISDISIVYRERTVK